MTNTKLPIIADVIIALEDLVEVIESHYDSGDPFALSGVECECVENKARSVLEMLEGLEGLLKKGGE